MIFQGANAPFGVLHNRIVQGGRSGLGNTDIEMLANVEHLISLGYADHRRRLVVVIVHPPSASPVSYSYDTLIHISRKTANTWIRGNIAKATYVVSKVSYHII